VGKSRTGPWYFIAGVTHFFWHVTAIPKILGRCWVLIGKTDWHYFLLDFVIYLDREDSYISRIRNKIFAWWAVFCYKFTRHQHSHYYTCRFSQVIIEHWELILLSSVALSGMLRSEDTFRSPALWEQRALWNQQPIQPFLDGNFSFTVLNSHIIILIHHSSFTVMDRRVQISLLFFYFSLLNSWKPNLIF
jgi:hypothetical protein